MATTGIAEKLGVAADYFRRSCGSVATPSSGGHRSGNADALFGSFCRLGLFCAARLSLADVGLG
jgi:hypothetical protein